MKRFVPLIMGSESDFRYVEQIGKALQDHFGIDFFDYRVASGHKVSDFLGEVVDEYDSGFDMVVYGCTAGRSDALSATADGMTPNPVFACRPDSDKCTRAMDIWSSLRMPGDVCPLTVLGAENSALQIAKVFGLYDIGIRARIEHYFDAGVTEWTETGRPAVAIRTTAGDAINAGKKFMGDFSRNGSNIIINPGPITNVPHIRLDRTGIKDARRRESVHPNIVCPFDKDKGGLVKDTILYMERSLEEPMEPVVFGLSNALLSAVKMEGLGNPELRESIRKYKDGIRENIRESDKKVRRG